MNNSEKISFHSRKLMELYQRCYGNPIHEPLLKVIDRALLDMIEVGKNDKSKNL